MFVEVAFNLPLNRTFHYGLPDHLATTEALIGRRVTAPFGTKTMVGYVIATQTQTPPFAIKPIYSFVDPVPFLDENLIALARWVAETYLCSVGEALSAILPANLMPPKKPRAEKEIQPIVKQPEKPLHLTTEQATALSSFIRAADSGAYHAFLLRGITSSGKTELYVRTIDEVLKKNRQAIFLVPEIALTPPFIDRLRLRYGDDKVGLWHSGLTPAQRYETWHRAKRGELQVILGVRSSVFAPLPKLGVIIMDEEHETSYKQEERPRYHTRDVALWRAKAENAVLIMGSATPSLESYSLAKQGTYTLVEMTSRVEERDLPVVTLVDRSNKDTAPALPLSPLPRRRVPRSASFEVFSEPLKLAIEQRLARKEQILLFVNRRGFTPFLRCSKCGWVARCDRCSMTLTEHVVDDKHALQCHACLKKYGPIIQCPVCKSMRLGHFGIGTQRVEQEVKKLYPFAKMARLDKDIRQARHAYEKVYRSFQAHHLDILVGTQVIAKGFDFPSVTLVGVVDADITLHLPDFRSAERTFQLITQVAGRTGRGDRKGQVFVQTQHAEHFALQAAKDHDYLRFYDKEIQDRQMLNYPPFCRLIGIVLRATKEPLVLAAADELLAQLEKINSGAEILGPAPSPYSRLRNQFRYQILIKGTDVTLKPCLEFLRTYRAKKAYASVDVDPMDLL